MDFNTSQKLYSVPNDKMVALLTMGIWTKLFSKKRYKRGGKTLLQIFPNKQKGKNQADVYKDLTHIREFRNRIAHHEPICFDGNGNINTAFARKHYELICLYHLIREYKYRLSFYVPP